jgi:PAS domain S-box-containing protein
MVPFLIFVILSLLVGLVTSWRRNRKLLAQARSAMQVRAGARTNELEKANEDLKTAQAELQRRWRYLAEAQRLSHSGTFGWKVSSGELVWSDETYGILGFTRATNPTLDLVFDRIHPEDVDRVRQLSDRAAQSGMDLDIEHRILLPDGVIKYVHAVAHAGRDSSGNLEYMGVVTDITERKRAEEELQALSRDLQESKAWLEEAQRVANVGYWVWNLPTNHLIWSDETYRIFGLSPQEGLIDLDKVREMIHPDDREMVFRTAEEAVRSGARADCEHRLFRPNGEMRVVHSLADLKRDASGRPQKMFGTTQDVTDRKRAEEALRRSQFYLSEGERLAHIGSWASSDLGIRWTDDLGIYWSDEVYKIFGLDARNGPPNLEQYLAAVHPDDRASMEETIRMMHEQRCGCDVTKRIVRPDGTLRYVRCVGVPVFEDGVFKAFHGTTIDVTEHELLTQELQREKAYLAEAQSLTHIGSWATNFHTGQMFHLSDEVYRLHGFEPNQGPSALERFWDTVHPEDEPIVRATLENAIRARADYDIPEFRVCHPDGSVRFLRTIGHHNRSGELGDYVGITMDITERKRAEQERERLRQLEADLTQELRRERAYLAEAQSLAHIGSWASNLATMHNFHLSDETYRIHGFDPRQGPIPLERFWATLHPEDAAEVRTAIENAVRAGTDYDVGDFRICRADDGQIRFLRTIGHRNPSSEPGEYLGITVDITERKHAEQEREKLRQLEADLAHINRVNMMGELAAALAHEIKQPIAASITSANALLRWLAHDPPDLERARAAATRIEQDGNRAADVINRLRSFYKKGAPPEREIVDVEDIIHEMIVLLRDEAVRNSITIHSELDAETLNILADRVQLQQVFMNLMLNAIEAMKDTGGELTIRSGLNPEGQLLISISDTGVGLPVENTERIFDAFHTTKPQGTGMGLAITRSIVESYGGRVWATPNDGSGATLHFTLPVDAGAHA